MRPILFPLLGAVFSLGASGAPIGNVVCDTEPDPGTNSTISSLRGPLDSGHCIEDICTSGGNAGSFTKSCGTITLTITHLSAPLSGLEDCINGFDKIIEKCSTSEGVYGGVLQISGVTYDVAVAASDGEGQHYSSLEARRGGGRSRNRKGSTSKTTKKGKKKTPTKPKTTKPKTTKPKTKKPKAKKPKSCPVPKKKGQKGKGKKTIRDLVEGFLPDVLSSAILPRTPAGSRPGSSAGSRAGSPSGSDSDGCDGLYFQKHELQPKKVEWYSFRTEDRNWDNTLGPSHKARNILRHMPLNSKFDAVKLHRASMQVVGDPTTSLSPEEWPVGHGSYLLTNGGFFDMAKHPKDDIPVGPTSLRSDYKPIPEVYEEYYKELRDGNQFLWSGPSLKTPLPLGEPKFKYGEFRGPGTLNHAGSGNERLAVAIVGHDKYLFTHMADDRMTDGVNVNKLRTLIDEFLKAYGGPGASVSQASTVLNLDGGGSIWMSWREGGRDRHVIARGDGKDDGPPFGNTRFAGSAREVVNLLKWTAG
ncbi:hypothetical protein P171DRAFT_430772 [Karstenula rhodostoma CBS 690.94]|uniref:Phosphodiester glycosidase domain-containing protein n=1 Tax=Karstenula rhodostoma CBS 690.94 TaxID=1392251 RepID=A0A9P4PJV3_9PLEO|nr:hypothetical protein P171DRAFT_430772 [Karstenula rhodostoma CBS 690.94]